jgi:mRNA-degrading endonuclease RelE of RelBE toxin-antitoxin system
MYKAEFDEEWPGHFQRLDNEMKERTAKKIRKILACPQKRHLKNGANFFVSQIGQYRIVYRIFEVDNKVRFYFVGDHKEYEKWYKQFF